MTAARLGIRQAVLDAALSAAILVNPGSDRERKDNLALVGYLLKQGARPDQIYTGKDRQSTLLRKSVEDYLVDESDTRYRLLIKHGGFNPKRELMSGMSALYPIFKCSDDRAYDVLRDVLATGVAPDEIYFNGARYDNLLKQALSDFLGGSSYYFHKHIEVMFDLVGPVPWEAMLRDKGGSHVNALQYVQTLAQRDFVFDPLVKFHRIGVCKDDLIEIAGNLVAIFSERNRPDMANYIRTIWTEWVSDRASAHMKSVQGDASRRPSCL